MNQIKNIYKILLKEYGHQGWWPLCSLQNTIGKNPTKTGSIKGYHPKDYTFPKNDRQRFEICIGAILTQNTSWQNVEKALINLIKIKALNPKKILSIDEDKIKNAIKPAGYYNQKTRKLKEFSKFFIELKNKRPKREELLNIWGIGEETADSILLYAYKEPSFVIDAYTKRILEHKKIINNKATYQVIKDFIENNLNLKDFKIYQEFHALIVEHSKRYYSKKPYGKDDMLLKHI